MSHRRRRQPFRTLLDRARAGSSSASDGNARALEEHTQADRGLRTDQRTRDDGRMTRVDDAARSAAPVPSNDTEAFESQPTIIERLDGLHRKKPVVPYALSPRAEPTASPAAAPRPLPASSMHETTERKVREKSLELMIDVVADALMEGDDETEAISLPAPLPVALAPAPKHATSKRTTPILGTPTPRAQRAEGATIHPTPAMFALASAESPATAPPAPPPPVPPLSAELRVRSHNMYLEGVEALSRGDVKWALGRVRLAASLDPTNLLYTDLVAHLERTLRKREAKPVPSELRGLTEVADEAQSARAARAKNGKRSLGATTFIVDPSARRKG